MVSELLTVDKREWRIEEVAALVFPDDLALIQTISISRFGCVDQRIWHYTKNGLYSVRSGYHVAMDMIKNGELVRKGSGMSSNPDTLRGVWRRIWSVMVPHKLQVFTWKACRNALVVRHNLERRRIRVVNKCDFCFSFIVNSTVFFLFGTSLQLNMARLGANDFLEEWQQIVQRTKKEVDAEALLQHVVFGFWRIWKCQNEVVFKGVRTLPQVAVELWQRHLVEFRDAMGDMVGEGGDVLRVRLSGVRNDLGDHRGDELGIGEGTRVLRDFAGIPKLARGEGGGFFGNAIMAEVEAVRKGLQAVVGSNVGTSARLVVESDSKGLIQMLNKAVVVDVILEIYLLDIWRLASFQSMRFCFTPCHCNHATHLIAVYVVKHGRRFG
ncbi:uncharacterized protein LOC125468410 [Pyrus x bretschneideri]|uniref:uncharacterized protein LOC125468410 n=1 Tax=Pyrus x bretschneideri TaxID=225117 RepID=UPI00203005FD|nr:uncharacterized protein LOC125468410 [Pyrus x bretschneideri]